MAHKVYTNHEQKISSDLEAETGSNYFESKKNRKTVGWGKTLSKTRNMPKKSRAAREQPSPGPSPSINAPVAGSMAWAAQLHAVMQQHAWAAVVQTPGGVAGQFAAHQALLVLRETLCPTRDLWCSLATPFTFR